MGQNFSGKIITLLICLLLIIAQTGCSDGKPSFQESDHSGSALYPETFQTYTLVTPQFELHIQDQLFDPETGTALSERVATDYETLSTLFGSDRTLQIYVIPATPTGAILTEGETIYCTPEDITEGAYRTALVRAYTGLTEPWKLAGAYAAAFGDDIDTETLAAYYSDETNFPTLSLFAAYFFDEYTDNSTLAIANDTAGAFTEFLLAEYGTDAFFGCTSQDGYRQAWLNSLGATGAYQPAYDLGFLDEAQYTSSEAYPLIITTANRTYSFSDNFVDTPESIQQILSFYHTGMETVLGYLRENAPDHSASQIESVWEEPFSYYFNGDLMRTYSDRSTRSFYVAGPTLQYIFQETFYFLIPQADGETQIWKNIGLADYLFAMADVPDPGYYNYFLTSPDQVSGDNGRYLSEVQNYYLAHAEYPAELNDFDFGLLYEAMAFVSLSHPSLEFDRPGLASAAIAEWTNQENKYLRYSGNSLTYPEAYLFTKYLVATYGLDDMLTYCITYATTAFENTFGLSYTEAFADFREAYGIPK